ncbi:MAG: ketohydroxyglutarate aldolase [Actinomycetota bacterium]|nr:ketohydroxyglutarate aldolase [Actinomycetota bacterium]
MPRPNERTEVVVSVKDEHLERLGAVAEELRSAGMAVGEVMDELGVVSGSIDAAKMEELSAVTGVANVERSREVRIPPPDSPVQ